MLEHRVRPPRPPAERKVYRPASYLPRITSYLPRIKKTYPRPMQDWPDIAADLVDTEPHMQVVTWLNTEHGMGLGHANTIVRYVKARRP